MTDTSPPQPQEAQIQHEKVVIIGSGPAAHTAAIYLARAELSPLLYEGFLAGGVAAGGQLTTTTDVENFPGFPEGINGYEFTERLRQQSTRFGTRILTETVAKVDMSQRPFTVYGENHGTVVTTDAIVIATGATARRLPVGDRYWQRGVSACAVCDGAAPVFRKKPLVVVGGGDSSLEEALFLTKFASKVIVVHRRDTLRASKIMQARAKRNAKIEFLYSHEIVDTHGDERGLLSGVVAQNVKTGEQVQLAAAGLFFAIGHEPNVKFLNGQVELDKHDNYIVTQPDSTATSVPGVFAAGDVQDRKWRQAITAAGTGAMAALEVEAFLAEQDVPQDD
eukprot:CAMPEP_0168794900 /NCGR_PEP_ID=MMETSP0725-20121227/15892_1 /TAXON_ID=265536 /ORGANISM="Amphiprora sp., Strain CCMP467" /LENGTH=335 /DNA_ID=CAMNT_0008845827 /DNA_START=86 /DNA_END=1090 /DNA_ORIENTATION=+